MAIVKSCLLAFISLLSASVAKRTVPTGISDYVAAPTVRPPPNRTDKSSMTTTVKVTPRHVLAPELLDLVVSMHNRIRRDEKASNMIQMSWNPTLAALAQGWVEQCQGRLVPLDSYNVSLPFPLSSVGMTGYMNYGISDKNISERLIADSMDYWRQKKDHYEINTGRCLHSNPSVCLQFVKMVWAETTDVGCGFNICPILYREPEHRNYPDTFFVICYYGPGGNYNKVPYKYGAPECSQCPEQYRGCNFGLCVHKCKEGDAQCRCIHPCQHGGQAQTDCTCQCTYWWSGMDCSEFKVQSIILVVALAIVLTSILGGFFALVCFRKKKKVKKPLHVAVNGATSMEPRLEKLAVVLRDAPPCHITHRDAGSVYDEIREDEMLADGDPMLMRRSQPDDGYLLPRGTDVTENDYERPRPTPDVEIRPVPVGQSAPRRESRQKSEYENTDSAREQADYLVLKEDEEEPYVKADPPSDAPDYTPDPTYKWDDGYEKPNPAQAGGAGPYLTMGGRTQ